MDGSIAISRTSGFVGAFPLSDGSKDSATIAYLNAGAYLAQAYSTDSTNIGEVLIEVYILP